MTFLKFPPPNFSTIGVHFSVELFFCCSIERRLFVFTLYCFAVHVWEWSWEWEWPNENPIGMGIRQTLEWEWEEIGTGCMGMWGNWNAKKNHSRSFLPRSLLREKSTGEGSTSKQDDSVAHWHFTRRDRELKVSATLYKRLFQFQEADIAAFNKLSYFVHSSRIRNCRFLQFVKIHKF